MRRVARALIALAAVTGVIALAAPTPARLAADSPACTDVGVSTRLCQTPGHAQITTSPNPALTNPNPWGFGGFGFGLGGGGIWIGF